MRWRQIAEPKALQERGFKLPWYLNLSDLLVLHANLEQSATSQLKVKEDAPRPGGPLP